jgi:methylated-DNA-[protein]-cysteine S-methyltransferase
MGRGAVTVQPPERLVFDRIATPVGEAILVSDQAEVLRGFQWADFEESLLKTLVAHYRGVPWDKGRSPILAGAFEAYFAGEVRALETVSWATAGTAFQRQVWSALTTIPAGRTLSYAALAAQAGRPMAVRAAGSANGRNPISVALPCHRVIGTGGDLTGYGGGLARKRWLLRHEGAAFRDAALA